MKYSCCSEEEFFSSGMEGNVLYHVEEGVNKQNVSNFYSWIPYRG